MRKLLLCQDDCADKHATYFERDLLKQFNLTIEDFTKGLHLGDAWYSEYILTVNGRTLALSYHADDPYWKLEEMESAQINCDFF